MIDESQLPAEISRTGSVSLPSASVPEIGEGFNYYDAIDRYERELIEATLARGRGVQKRAAEMLGLKATTLNEKIKRLGIGQTLPGRAQR